MHQNFSLNQSSVGVTGHSIRNSRCHHRDSFCLFTQESQLLFVVAFVKLWHVFALQARVFLINDLHGREKKIGKNFADFAADSVN